MAGAEESCMSVHSLHPTHRGLWPLGAADRWRIARASWLVIALVACLPFEATQRPLPHVPLLTLTNLSGLFLLLGLAALWQLLQDVRGTLAARIWPAGLWIALVVWSLASALSSQHPLDGVKWTVDLVLGGLIWLALPTWLGSSWTSRPRGVVGVLAGAAAIAAVVGLLELYVGTSLDAGPLSVFKAQPTVVGPYLRLSGTFDYANTAAGFFAPVLPLVVALALDSRGAARRYRWAASGAAGLIVVALAGTSSRGGVAAAACGLCLLLVAARHTLMRRHWLSRRTTVGAAIALATLLRVGAVAGQVGVLRLSTQSDLEWYHASYTAALPRVVHTSQTIHVRVTVHNTGAAAWSTAGRHPFRLGYHWLAPSGHIAILNGRRTPFRHAVPPGGSTTVLAAVKAPPRPGRYRLVWDIAQESVLWFALQTGAWTSTAIQVSGTVTPGAVTSVALPVTAQRLPTTPQQPERPALWGAALRMIAAHPLLGVGPDGYRLAYGLFERPPVRSWDTRIFANSLPLELAADLGLPGAILFFAFLAAVTWRLLGRAVRGDLDLLSAAVLAALGALLAHGIVDYTLGARAILYLLWVLLGLAAIGPALTDRTGAPGPC
jgi:O-antigen ligase